MDKGNRSKSSDHATRICHQKRKKKVNAKTEVLIYDAIERVVTLEEESKKAKERAREKMRGGMSGGEETRKENGDRSEPRRRSMEKRRVWI